MAPAARLVAAVALTLAALAALPAASRADCPALRADQLCIDRPRVTQPVTNMNVTFARGSFVQVGAGGCVQTGGSGDTWKRYINPDPPGGTDEYFGSLGILSLTGGPPTIASGTRFSVVSQFGGPAFVVLTIDPDTAPRVTARRPGAFVTGLTQLQADATDDEGDPIDYAFKVDGTTVGDGPSSSVAPEDVLSGLAPDAYVFEVRTTDAVGNVDATPVTRRFTVATAPPAPAPTPAPPPPPPPPPPKVIRSTVVYAYASFTRLTRLTVQHVPAGATVRVTCSGPCPKALKRPFVKRVTGGSPALARLVRGSLRPGMKIVIAVTELGWIRTKKTLRMRRGRPPAVG